jgi:glycosyltransferase involved in cell wall biosynthesis
VATSVGGIPEVVEDGLTGRLVPPADLDALTDAIREVLRSGNEMGQRARARCIERFELGWVADKWDQLLRELQPGRESGRGKRAA